MTEVANPLPTWGPDGLGELNAAAVFGGGGETVDPRRTDPNLEILQFSEVLADYVARLEGGEPTPEDKEKFNETLLSEVTRWSKRIQRYQEENRELEEKNMALSEDVEKARVDKMEIIEYLRDEAKEKKAKLTNLQSDLRDTTESKDAKIASLEKELKDYEESSTEKIECLTEQISSVERQLDALKHFEQEKAKMDAELKQLNETIMRDQIEHREKIRTLEREWEIERDRRDKEERRAIAKAEQDMLKIQDQHISEVTRKAIEDNAQLELEIAYQSRQVKQLYEENGDYTRTTIQLRRELEVQQDAERVLAQKNCSYQKTIKALLAKMKKLEQENAVYKGEIDAFSAAGNPPPQRDMRMTSSTEGGFELDAETATLADAQAKLGALKKDAKANRAEAKRLRAKLGGLEEVCQEAARYIMASSGGEGGSRPGSTGSLRGRPGSKGGQLPGIKGAGGGGGSEKGSDYAVQLYIRIKSQLSS